jgi:hypothetical protein
MQGTPTSRKSGSNAPYRPIKSWRRRALFATASRCYRLAARRDQRFGGRDLPTFRAPFGACSRASFSSRAMNVRSADEVGTRLRGARGATAGSDSRVSILAKRR